ncbi:MAG: DUF2442 domain-containing protein [Lentisphaeria bacterium]|jgi:hypothetical protein
MRIAEVKPMKDGTLWVVADDGCSGIFDVRPYLSSQAFLPLKDWSQFSQVRNGGYYVEWKCGADLSSDTIEARWTAHAPMAPQQTASADGLTPAEP